jgi:uncharacterized membrane protein
MRVAFTSLALACAAFGLLGCHKLGARKAQPGLVGKGPFAGPLNAAGETPFWMLRIRDQSLIYTGPDHQAVSFPNGGPEVSSDQAVWTGKSADGRSAKITLASKACQDEATSIGYPMTATVEIGGQTLKGCATRAGEGLGSRE